jgi:hypothetical protein
MSPWPAIDWFLNVDPRDVGCEEAMRVLHVYVEIVAGGEDPDFLYPGVTAHLRACGPCGNDFEGLLSAIGGVADGE